MIEIDDQHWPLVIFRFHGEVSPAQVEAYLERQEKFLARCEHMVSLVFADQVKMWDVPLLKRQAAWINHHQELLRRYSLGVAFVLRSPIGRGMLKAVLWMQPLPQPHAVCGSVEDALRWLRQRVAAANPSFPLPSKL